MMEQVHNNKTLKAESFSDRPSQKGFTLVELSIVLVIIGLIIGGVLKGQELIANAQIKNLVSQIQSYQAALVSFRDKYNGLPGDLANAQLLIPNCTAAPCTPTATGGDGNGQIGATAIGANFNVNISGDAETLAAWQQLASSRFIGGIVLGTTGTTTYGSRLPNAETGGGFQIGFDTVTGRHILRLSGAVITIDPANGALRPDQALQIDNILDDGLPNTGAMRTNATISDGAGADACITVATNIYTAANGNRRCNLILDIN